jgi:hypothetical protein
MAKVKGIFEPFQPYVREQLKLRKEILANLDDKQNIISNLRYSSKPELFHAYATEKQCTIRMMSGVDIRPESYEKVLELDKSLPRDALPIEDETYLQRPSRLARQYILEGGTRYYDDKIKWGWRGGFTTGIPTDDHKLAFAYGDKNVRANPDGDYGPVPMPGITDAVIKTKSQNGALREAQVNFKCFNRRQLEVLEMLYMRPGFPVCLEWGWNPYVSNQKTRETLDYTIKKEFFKETATLDSINDKIRKYKVAAGGNYDGFVGYVKNFQFKAREDGGFDCTTEIIAHGEILESLKSPGIKTHRFSDETEDLMVEITDRLLFYMRALKYQFNSEGSQIELQRYMTGDDALRPDDEDADNLRKVPQPPEDYTGASLAQREKKIQLLQEQNNAAYNAKGLDSEREKDIYDISNNVYNPHAGVFDLYNSDRFSYNNETPEEFMANRPEFLTFLEDNQLKQQWLESGQLNKEIFQAFLDQTDVMAEINHANIMSDQYNAMDSTWVSKEYRTTARDNPIADAKDNSDETASLNDTKNAWNEYIKIYSQEQDLRIPLEYRVAYGDIARLFKYINKETDSVKENQLHHIVSSGFESLLGGAILRQTIKYPEYVQYDYSQTKEVVVKKRALWWNKTVDVKVANAADYDSGRRRNVYIRWDLLCQMINHLANATSDEVSKKLLTIYNKAETEKPSRGLPNPSVELTYMNANSKTWNNNSPDEGKTDNGTNYSYLEYMPCINHLADPAQNTDLPAELEGKYHPLIGNSYDERVCLLPHQKIFDDMFEHDRVYHGTYYQHDALEEGELVERGSEKNEDVVNLRTINSYKSEYKAKDMRNSIGFIYFNLDYLLNVYESLRLKKAKNPNSTGESTYITLNDDFTLFDFVSTIWQGVNDSTGGYYNFQLHVEHEQPNKARVVDMRLFGDPDPNIYKFEPQSLKSITRQFFFDSKIDSNMAAAISIAAQAPNSEQDLDSLSFKAFHKNIKSRFILQDFEYTGTSSDLKQKKFDALYDDIIDFNSQYNMLIYYMKLMNNSNYDTELITLQPHQAVTQIKRFIELRANILYRFPLYEEDGTTQHEKAGFWRKGTTLESNAIIPLQCNLQLDGIAGLIPLQLFKIAPDKLPKGYDRDDISFVVKSESQKITDSQDWVTEITGQLALLNENPNNSGVNNIFDYTDPPEVVDEVLNNPLFQDNTPWADHLRDVIKEFNHTERSYVEGALAGLSGKRDTWESKAKEYHNQLITRGMLLAPPQKITSGELSSNGDLQPDMAAFMMIFLRCMDDEDYANKVVYGENYADEISEEKWYSNDGELSNLKLIFTGGNDIEHTDSKYGGTVHDDGRAVDFVLNYKIDVVTEDIILSDDPTNHNDRKRWRIFRELAKEFARIWDVNCNYHHYTRGEGENSQSYTGFIDVKDSNNDFSKSIIVPEGYYHAAGVATNFDATGAVTPLLYARSPSLKAQEAMKKKMQFRPRYAAFNNLDVTPRGREYPLFAEDEDEKRWRPWDKSVENRFYTYYYYKINPTPISTPATFEKFRAGNLFPPHLVKPRTIGMNPNKYDPEEFAFGQLFDYDGAVMLNRIVKLLVFLKNKFPNMWWIDEYRKPGKTASGFHFHIYAPGNNEIIPLDKMMLSKNQLKLQDSEVKIHPNGWGKDFQKLYD